MGAIVGATDSVTMEHIHILSMQEHPQLIAQAAQWFHDQWGIPLAAYQDSMAACVAAVDPVPQWYVAVVEDALIGGLGVIANDFHNRPDLTPNLCALFVAPPWRGRGLAGRLLTTAVDDMKKRGMDTLYLLTDHTSFYERYGWEYLCPVQGDGEPQPSRMYVHRA